MPNPAIGLIGASIGGSALQSKAAKSAAGDANAANLVAAQMQVDEMRRQFNALRKIQSPYVQAGNQAMQGMLNLYGMGGASARQGAIQRLRGSDQFEDMSAAERQAALRDVRRDPRFSDDRLQKQAIGNIRNSPQFASMMRAGEDAILTNASATGGLRGGNTQRALAEFRPALLSSMIDQRLAGLGGLTGMGQNAASGVGNAGLQTGANIANAYGQMGASNAGAALARGQANVDMFGGISGAIGNVMGQYAGGGMPGGLFSKGGF